MVGGDAGTRAIHVHADDFFVLGKLIVAGGMRGQPVSERYLLLQWPELRPLRDKVLLNCWWSCKAVSESVCRMRMASASWAGPEPL